MRQLAPVSKATLPRRIQSNRLTELDEAAVVATALEYLRERGYSAAQIKTLFSPDVIDEWFGIKDESSKRSAEVPS